MISPGSEEVDPARTRRTVRREAMRIVLAYALTAAVWIIVTDRLVGMVALSPRDAMFWSIAKGLAFVVATSALLTVMLLRLLQRLQAGADKAREIEERFRAVVVWAPDAIYVQTRGQFAYLNPAAVRLFGVGDPSQLLGTPVIDRFHPDDRAVVAERIRRVNEERLPVPPVEERVTGREGRYIDVEVAAVPFHFEGQPGALVTARDITERKRAETERDLAEQRVVNALDLARAAHWEFDLHGGVFTFNDRFYALLGTTAEREGGYELAYEDYLRRFLFEEDTLAVTARAGRLSETADPQDLVPLFHRVRRRDGETRYLQVVMTFERDAQGNVVLAHGVNQDVTERVLIQLREKEHAETLHDLNRRLIGVQENERRHLARELHDEIGQALTALKVNLDRMRRAPADTVERISECLGIVDQTIQRVRGMTLDLRPSMLDDLGLVAALRWYVRQQAQRTGSNGVFHVDPESLQVESEIETACFRAVQEALTNVARHASASGFSVELNQGPTGLHLVVRDDGVGFDPVVKLSNCSRGTSIGLIGMRERVEMAGGHVEFVSAPGQGTEVRITFPDCLADPPDSAEERG